MLECSGEAVRMDFYSFLFILNQTACNFNLFCLINLWVIILNKRHDHVLYVFLSAPVGKVSQEDEVDPTPFLFVCGSSLDVSGGDLNHDTFIPPLNLEHSSLPCRIQN